MKVILIKDLKNLGKKGAVKNVPQGFARNFLFPNNLALLATEVVLKKMEEEKLRGEVKERKDKKNYQKLFDELKILELVITVKANPQEKIFGGLNSLMIERKLEEFLKKDISPFKLELNEPIKILGDYKIPLILKGERAGELKIKVVAQE